MNIRETVTAAYQSAGAFSSAPDELKHSPKTNDRVPNFITRLTAEIQALPPRLVSRETIIDMTTGLTNLFLAQVEASAKQMHMTEMEKHAREHIAERNAIINNAADTGVITDEVIDALKETD